MTVESIGNIADAYNNGKLPKCGMIISASREELMKVAGNVLYKEVVVAADLTLKELELAKYAADNFNKQIYRCGEICDRIDAEQPRQYSRDEVLAIIDELLDGIKPKKGRVKKAGAEACHHKDCEVTV